MIIHFFAAAGIISLVLLQRGKGAEAGAGFGAGASGTVFGARGAGTALSRATAVLAGIFMLTSLSLTYVGSRTAAPPATILDRLSQPTPGQPVTVKPQPASPAPASPAPAAPAPASPAQ
ncbi:MAG TPA: preprotein translocase subunit SecG [Chloroflexota bacterium]|nr:preprotein translocase subunit SecG [Chloroflexota bacterium]